MVMSRYCTKALHLTTAKQIFPHLRSVKAQHTQERTTAIVPSSLLKCQGGCNTENYEHQLQEDFFTPTYKRLH